MTRLDILLFRLFANRNRRKANLKSHRMYGSVEALESRSLLAINPLAPQVGEWGPVLDWGLQAKHMAVLQTGDVLVWSTGQNASVWDSSTDASFTAVPFFVGDLHCAAQVTLADGRVVVFGGVDVTPHVGINITALFDPLTNTWTSGANMNFERWYATATTLGDGRVLVTSGDDHDQVRVTVPEIYDPVTDTWTVLPGADRSQILYPEMFVLPNGKVYEAGTKKDTWLLDVAGNGSWTAGPTNSFGSSGYSESAVTYSPGKILRVGGGDPAWGTSAVADMNVASPAWRTVESMEFARRRMNLSILADGSVLATGGTRTGDNESDAVLAGEIWNPETEQWTTVAAMSEARMYHSSAVLLPDGRVVTGGGEADGRKNAQIYSPPYLFQGSRPTITSAPGTASYGSSFAISTPQAAEITSVALIRPQAVTHGFDHNQRYVPLSFQRSDGQLQVTAPANGNVAPPGYYMLVIENGSGVPSVAAWIQVNSSTNLAPGTILGRVTNASTGAGIAGATVSTIFGSVLTNGSGDYTLTQVPPGEHLVTVTAAGFATASQAQTVLPNQTATLNLSLVAPGAVTGQVISLATGQPLPAATITYVGGHVTTGPDGTYTASGVPSGSQTIVASAIGYDTVAQTVVVLANGSIAVNFSLPTALTAIQGEVRDFVTSDPIVGATVTYNRGSVTTDAFGFYRFNQVAEGDYTVSVQALGYVGATENAAVVSGFPATADFNLHLFEPSIETFTPTDDALINSSSPDKNYGQLGYLRVRSSTAYNSYLKFNVGALSGPLVKATLKLFATDGSNNAGALYLVSNNLNGSGTAWTENNLTWNNAPLISGTPLDDPGAVATNAVAEFDVTQAITGDGIYSFALTSSSTNSAYYSSSEGAQPPTLTIETASTLPVIALFSPASGRTGEEVTLHGANFSGTTAVMFNGTASLNVTVVSDTELRAIVPVGATIGPLSVTTPAGTVTTGASFIWLPAPPKVTTTASDLMYIENDGPAPIDPDLEATADSAAILGATVAISDGFVSGEDVLEFMIPDHIHGITGSYNSATGVLTLTGTASLPFYKDALRSVTYFNPSDIPTAADRTVTFSISDGTYTGSGTRKITVTPVNDAPTAIGNAYTVNRGATLNASDASGTVGGSNDNSVLLNDTDVENNALSAVLAVGPTHASAFTLNPNGTFTYTHNNDTATSDSFTYRASDGTNQSNIATVTFTINPGGGTTTTVSLQDGVNGYTGTIDTTIRASFPTSTSGAAATSIEALDNPDRGSLLRWELPSSLTGSIVQSASITLSVTNKSASTFQLYELLRSWTEGAATWNQFAADAAWGTAGAQQVGVDRAAAVVASLTASATGFLTINLNADGIAMVQKWINTPSTNHGVTIQNYVTTTADIFTFASSEATTAANRPKLTITYSADGPINNPPTITTTASALSYTENNPATSIDPGLTTSDVDSVNYVGATVSITGGFASGQDVLGFANQNGISGTYNAATGVLTLTGTSSVANYQAALRSVTYANTSENPSAANRMVTFSVNDGALTGSGTRTITVTPVNDAPTANNNGYVVIKGATLNANDAAGTVGGTGDDSVLVNDSDPENEGLMAMKVTDPTHGTLTLNSDGTFTYTHNNDNATSDSFSYRVTDGMNHSNFATVTITINPGGGTSTTVSLQEGVNGYAGTIDTTIKADYPTSATSSSAVTVEAKDNPDRALLLRWELPSSLTGNIVQSASITVWVTNSSKTTYQLYELLRSWTEGGATWNQYTAGAGWGTAGAQRIDVDRAAAVLASLTLPNTGFATINLNADGIAMVQKWINTPSTNHGVTIQNYVTTSGDGVGFDSSEATSATNRPKLTITYGSGSPPMAASTASMTSSSPTGSDLTEAALVRIGQEATARWLSSTPAGIHDAIRTAAGSITFAIADLPGQTLGTSFAQTILIDRDAAGFGWFIDRTPYDDREFGASHDATLTSPADGHMDLLSVVAHEIGHLLGYDHDSSLDTMCESLEAGQRTMTGVSRPREGVSTSAIDAYFQGIGSYHSGLAVKPFDDL